MLWVELDSKAAVKVTSRERAMLNQVWASGIQNTSRERNRCLDVYATPLLRIAPQY